MDLSKYWLARAISSGTGHDSYNFVSFCCGGEQGIGHDSDGFIADERAMGVYHFCLDQRLTAPGQRKKHVFYLLNRRLAPSNSEKTRTIFAWIDAWQPQTAKKTRTIFAWIDAWQLQTSKNHVHFCLDRHLGLGGLEAWKLGGLEGWVKSRTVGVYFHAIGPGRL